jgi:CMP-N-acetylneuraminic acid synthetase
MKQTTNFRHLAVIPARGDSKGIKNKNLQLVGNKSLVKWSWDSCIDANFFDVILLSTDSNVIAKNIDSKINFSNVDPDSLIFKTPKLAFHYRSSTDAQDLSLIETLLYKISKFDELNFDYLWLIQPTTPFRLYSEFIELKNIVENQLDFTSLVSVKDVTSNHPNRMFTIRNKYLKNYLTKIEDESIPRQLLDKVYIRDGGYYIFPRKQLVENSFLGNKILPFIRPLEGNINIDSNTDLLFARFLVRQKEFKDNMNDFLN